jgi:protein required for attachment to host cells
MSVTEMYNMLAKMTPQERLDYIAKEQQKINNKIIQSQENKLLNAIKSSLDTMFQDKAEFYKEEFGDNYKEAMEEEYREFVGDNDDFWGAIKQYMLWVI